MTMPMSERTRTMLLMNTAPAQLAEVIERDIKDATVASAALSALTSCEAIQSLLMLQECHVAII